MIIDKQKDCEFIMKLGSKVKDLLVEGLKTEYNNHDDRARMLFSFLSNFSCNTIADLTQGDKLKENIDVLLNQITLWSEGKFTDARIARFDPQTESCEIFDSVSRH